MRNTEYKINDCLNSPMKIGIAIAWIVVDTAKAVFNVYKNIEYLFLNGESVVRDIAGIYL